MATYEWFVTSGDGEDWTSGTAPGFASARARINDFIRSADCHHESWMAEVRFFMDGEGNVASR